jgi:hypothetical protein
MAGGRGHTKLEKTGLLQGFNLCKLFFMKKLLTPALIILFCWGCASVNTYSDIDRSIDFSGYRTFAWLPTPMDTFKNGMYDNQIIENNVKNHVNKEMFSRGYRTDVDSPDLILEYNILVEKALRTVENPIYSYPYNYNWGYSPYYDSWYRYRYGFAGPPYVIGYNTTQIPYTQGTLTLSVIDRKKNRLIWRGWSVGTMSDPGNYHQVLEKDVKNIFKKYPVQVKDQKKR